MLDGRANIPAEALYKICIGSATINKSACIEQSFVTAEIREDRYSAGSQKANHDSISLSAIFNKIHRGNVWQLG